MDEVTPIIRSRKRRRAKHRQSPAGRAGLTSATALSLAIALCAIISAFLFSRIAQDLPAVEQLARLLSPTQGELLEPTRLYDQTGSEILWSFENPRIEKREYIPLDALAETEIAAATITAADPSFWSRSNWQLLNWRTAEDANSMPQRLVSDLLFWNEPESLQRELRERILAAQAISQFGREQILEWYLNNTYYGHQLYGIEAAAQVYLGKPSADLSLAEAALLAVVGEAPALNPFDAPQAARERQQELLHAMLIKGYITSEQVRQASDAEITIQEEPLAQRIPAFVTYVLAQAVQDIPESRLKRGGFKIITTLDADLQQQATCAAQHQIARVSGSDAPVAANCEAARLLPTLYTGGTPAEETAATPAPLTTSVIMLNPQNGHLLAMTGGGPQGIDLALRNSHPAGSILDPFVYLTAFTHGDAPSTMVLDIPYTFSLSAEDAHPHCRENCEYKGPVRLRTALANDYLVPALKYWEKLGQTSILNILTQFGVAVEVDASALWGGQAVTLLDIAQAYGVLGNQGVLEGWSGSDLRPVSVSRIESEGGKVWRETPNEARRPVIGTQLAYLITDALADETARWPSLGHPNVLEIGRPVGVKIGHTWEGNTAWTVGYTPQRVIAVWAGFGLGDGDSAAPNANATPPRMAALPEEAASGLWRAIAQYSTRDLPPLGWEMPPGITTLNVCEFSGMLPTEYCPATVREIFIAGSEPVQADTLYQVREVNRETGRLATVFTQPELIEERVYLIVPPEAADWAAGKGLSTPPETYDVIYQPSFSENLHILEPENFAYVRGEVLVKGTASGSDFLSYQIQIGKGLNPETWQQYGTEVTDRVTNAPLWRWDTSEFEDGLYALRVIVLREEQRVEKATILVSVDNTPPELALLAIEDGQIFQFEDGERLTFQAQVSDNVELDAVMFTLNGKTLAERIEPPFAYAWEMKWGTYTLVVNASDMAGNVTVKEVSFSVER
ncbi:MAG: hypothetical protein DRI56_04635 [Chloroflexota bacterium]|nr:MAG: hypothetical protein DRI56_04635 [Chloroflexota bacterium]